MEISGKNRIGGESAGGGGSTFRAVNPASGAELEPAFQEADAALVDRAFVAADGAFPAFSSAPAADRARLLRAIGDELLGLGAVLIERAQLESGLPAARLEGERGRAVGQLRMFATLLDEGSWAGARIDTADPARVPLPRSDIRRILEPVGPVAVFAASNFPLAFSVAGGDTASALAAGCPVVCKAHPAHPGTSELAAGAIDRAARSTGMPAGVFSLLHGWSHEVGLAMTRHPLARAVGFTGSLRGGRAIFDAAAARDEPIPVYAEMGSINPVFLLPSALAQRSELIARGLAQSIMMGVGQFCTNPGVLLGVRGADLDRLTAALAEKIGAAPSGVMLYAGLARNYAAAVATAQTKGAAMVAAAPENGGPAQARPTLLTTDVETFLGAGGLREEMFGPVSVVVAGKDAADLVRVAEALDGQLTATIHGTEEELLAHAPLVAVLRRKVGRLVFNGFPTGVEVGHAMHHGGPYPASTDSRTTSVGSAAIDRFARPVCYQDFPDAALPVALRNHNVTGAWRMIDGRMTRDDVPNAAAGATPAARS